MEQNSLLGFQFKLEDFLSINSDCNIYWYDKQHRLLGCNDHMFNLLQEILGLNSRSDIIGKEPKEFLPPEGVDIIYEENNKVMSTRTAHQFFNVVKLRSKRTLLFVTVKVPLYDQDKEVAGVFGISHLISSYFTEGKLQEKLSKREFDCLVFLLKGKTASETAELLCLSRRTVEGYIASIKTKLRCNSKSSLINLVYELGLSSLNVDIRSTSQPFRQGDFLPKEEQY